MSLFIPAMFSIHSFSNVACTKRPEYQQADKHCLYCPHIIALWFVGFKTTGLLGNCVFFQMQVINPNQCLTSMHLTCKAFSSKGRSLFWILCRGRDCADGSEAPVKIDE